MNRHKSCGYFLILFCCAWSVDSSNVFLENISSPDVPIERLPSNVLPVHYHLKLKVNLPNADGVEDNDERFTTTGTVTCELRVVEDTDLISLHIGEDITVTQILITSTTSSEFADNSDVTAGKTEDRTQELLHIQLGKTLTKDNIYSLSITYQGKIAKEGPGIFYYSDRAVLLTHFEATFARRMVPCFDEPALKATWEVVLVHPRGTEALSNGQENESYDDGSFLETTFSRTPLMSSYLLCIAVGNFKQVSAQTKHGRRIRGFAPLKNFEKDGALEQALNYTIVALENAEDLFGFFPNQQKLDFILTGIGPSMENLGLIVYGVDPNGVCGKDMKFCALVVLHEVIHQWIGNLVTPVWWNHLWLSEGLTTFMSCLAGKNLSSLFDQNVCCGGFTESSLYNASLIPQHDVLRGDFDQIYNAAFRKGHALNYMLYSLIGHQNFVTAVKEFTTLFANKTVESLDFLDVLQRHSPSIDLKGFSEPWMNQVGYPILYVQRTVEQHILITRKQFPETGVVELECDIPVFFENGTMIMLTKEQNEIIIHADDTNINNIPLLNTNSAGPYRVYYANWGDVLNNYKTNDQTHPKHVELKLGYDLFHCGSLCSEEVANVSRALDEPEEKQQELEEIEEQQSEFEAIPVQHRVQGMMGEQQSEFEDFQEQHIGLIREQSSGFAAMDDQQREPIRMEQRREEPRREKQQRKRTRISMKSFFFYGGHR